MEHFNVQNVVDLLMKFKYKGHDGKRPQIVGPSH